MISRRIMRALFAPDAMPALAVTLRSALYRLARLLGDLNALQRGPRAVAKRIMRRALGQAAGKAIIEVVPPER